jgi:hypothetical protein
MGDPKAAPIPAEEINKKSALERFVALYSV